MYRRRKEEESKTETRKKGKEWNRTEGKGKERKGKRKEKIGDVRNEGRAELWSFGFGSECLEVGVRSR